MTTYLTDNEKRAMFIRDMWPELYEITANHINYQTLVLVDTLYDHIRTCSQRMAVAHAATSIFWSATSMIDLAINTALAVPSFKDWFDVIEGNSNYAICVTQVRKDYRSIIQLKLAGI